MSSWLLIALLSATFLIGDAVEPSAGITALLGRPQQLQDIGFSIGFGNGGAGPPPPDIGVPLVGTAPPLPAPALGAPYIGARPQTPSAASGSYVPLVGTPNAQPPPPLLPPARSPNLAAPGQRSCDVPSIADPSFSATTVAFLASDIKQHISEDCFTVTVTSLAVCIPDLSQAQGCCSRNCSNALHVVSFCSELRRKPGISGLNCIQCSCWHM